MDNTILKPDWHAALHHTLEICEKDEQYLTYTVREKLLSFVFTFIQTLQENENLFSSAIRSNRLTCMNVVKADTQQYFEQLIWEGSNTGEIQSRLYLSSYYKDALWNMLLSVVNFWQRDQSAFKERTDVYIEKSVHFTVDLLSPNALDSGFDLIQQFIKWR